MKREHDEVAAEMRTHEMHKTKLKEERKSEKKKDYEDLVRYNPWGQPAVGAPKVS